MRFFVGLLLAAGSGMGLAAELPVRSVVLYKHGVGFFERSGELGRGESARLDFKHSEMNDVLKSLTVSVQGGPGVAGLRYDSSEPLDRKLSQFPIRLKDHQPLSALLDQLKGARLELGNRPQQVAGVIVSARVVPATQAQAEQEQVTLLLDSGEIRIFELSSAAWLRFPDPRLQLVFKDYLATLEQARSADKRSVYIDSTDSGQRRIAASYMIPTPVWKSSYRLIFPSAGEPTLEGWAIVDNTTGEDWTNISLALVSGRPVSFVSRLYEPRYIERPAAELAEEKAAAPPVHGGAVGGVLAMQPETARAKRGPQPAFAAPAAPPMAAFEMARVEAPSTVAATAEGRELGELFEYRFSTPVTVRKNESAMLPFLQQKITARRLLIYSDHSSAHPFNAAELTNSTGKTLDGGPVTVYDGGVYAGEALFETIKNGDKRLASYGIDIGTRISTRIGSSADLVREIKLSRGVLTTRSAIRETRNYTIRNVDARPKTLVLEHPLRSDYRLLNQKPAETTATAYRFEVKLAGAATAEYPVEEERLIEQSVAVSNLNIDMLASYASNKALSPQGRKALESILDRKRQIAQIDGDLRRAETEMNEITKDQARLRENLAALGKVSGQQDQVQRYASQLASQESQLASLRDRIAELRRKKAALETELNSALESLEF